MALSFTMNSPSKIKAGVLACNKATLLARTSVRAMLKRAFENTRIICIFAQPSAKQLTVMKTIVQKLICATLMMLPYVGFSQSGYTQATDMDVNGVFIGGTYVKAQVEAKWGTPTKYRSGMSEFGLDETY